MRALLALLFLVLLGTFAPPSLYRPQTPPAVTRLTIELIQPPEMPASPLVFRGGWHIESNDFRFGGLSALHVEDGQVTAFSDAGWLIRFAVPTRAAEAEAQIEALRMAPGDPHAKADRDIEAMVVHGPLAWVALERTNAVWRFRRGSWAAEAGFQPPAMEKWRANRGAEAMLRLPDGRFLLFAEGEGGLSEVLVFEGDPAAAGTRTVAMRYRPPEGHRITDAAMLPDGRMLFLNRDAQFVTASFSVKLTAARMPAVAEGAIIEPELVADLPPLDNLEALSVTQEGGRTILWMASDNNYFPLQRTLLLRFELTR